MRNLYIKKVVGRDLFRLNMGNKQERQNVIFDETKSGLSWKYLFSQITVKYKLKTKKSRIMTEYS